MLPKESQPTNQKSASRGINIIGTGLSSTLLSSQRTTTHRNRAPTKGTTFRGNSLQLYPTELRSVNPQSIWISHSLGSHASTHAVAAFVLSGRAADRPITTSWLTRPAPAGFRTSTRSASRSQPHLAEPLAPPGLSLARCGLRELAPVLGRFVRPPRARESYADAPGQGKSALRRSAMRLDGRSSTDCPPRTARDPTRPECPGPASADCSAPTATTRPGVPECLAWMTCPARCPVLAEDALLGLLLPFWQLVIGGCRGRRLVLVSMRRLARRGPSRMTTALLVTGRRHRRLRRGRRTAAERRQPPSGPQKSRRLARLGSSARIVAASRSRSRSATASPDAVGRLGEDRPPRVDHHAAAEAGAARLVVADLAGRHHEALVLDRPRPQQHLPVVPPGVHHERRRHHQQLRAAGDGQLPVELREAQVVADRQADRSPRRPPPPARCPGRPVADSR